MSFFGSSSCHIFVFVSFPFFFFFLQQSVVLHLPFFASSCFVVVVVVLLLLIVCRGVEQQATAVAITADGDYVVAGWTAGDYFEENAGSGNADDDSDGGEHLPHM